MRSILLIISSVICLVGCASQNRTTKTWHISPPSDYQWSEVFVIIPYDKACEIKSGMTEDELKTLVGGTISTSVKMPGVPLFMTHRSDGINFEVAVKMNDKRIATEISFKEKSPTNSSTLR